MTTVSYSSHCTILTVKIEDSFNILHICYQECFVKSNSNDFYMWIMHQTKLDSRKVTIIGRERFPRDCDDFLEKTSRQPAKGLAKALKLYCEKLEKNPVEILAVSYLAPETFMPIGSECFSC